MKRCLIALLLALSLPLSACDKPRAEGQWPLTRTELEQNAPTQDPAEGTYRRYCLSCHGVDGRGHGGVTGADFLAAESPLDTKSDETLLVSIRDGKRGVNASMPAHKPVLSEAQIRSVLAYVRKRFNKPQREQGIAVPQGPSNGSPAAPTSP